MERVRADVRVTAPVTAELVAHALREAVKFLLFVRQQIPASYDELRAALLQTVGPEAMGLPSAREATGTLASLGSSPVGAKRKRVTSVERAAVKLFREMDAALGCLTPEMLRAFEPSRVALFLGSTPARPKEMFVFSLADVNARGGYARHDREESPETTRAFHAEHQISNARSLTPSSIARRPRPSSRPPRSRACASRNAASRPLWCPSARRARAPGRMSSVWRPCS